MPFPPPSLSRTYVPSEEGKEDRFLPSSSLSSFSLFFFSFSASHEIFTASSSSFFRRPYLDTGLFFPLLLLFSALHANKKFHTRRQIVNRMRRGATKDRDCLFPHEQQRGRIKGGIKNHQIPEYPSRFSFFLVVSDIHNFPPSFPSLQIIQITRRGEREREKPEPPARPPLP